MSQAVAVLVAMMQVTPAPSSGVIADRIGRLTRGSTWTRVQSVSMSFKTYHPQGMVKIGAALFVSSVAVSVPTKRGIQTDPRYDRDAGEGVGHLFKIDMSGRLISDLTLGEGVVYHPGGIDFDGIHIWVPVAEYRPNSRSIIYRVDPTTMTAVEVLRVADHIGAIVHNTDDHTLHGVSWGSRRFYRWSLDRDGRVTDSELPLERSSMLNRSHYLDYQDCKYVGQRRMMCTGVTEFRATPGGEPFRLGGVDVIDLRDGRPVHQVPVQLWTGSGLDMTHNPSWFETTAAGLRAYFMPEDDTSTLYVYDVETER